MEEKDKFERDGIIKDKEYFDFSYIDTIWNDYIESIADSIILNGIIKRKVRERKNIINKLNYCKEKYKLAKKEYLETVQAEMLLYMKAKNSYIYLNKLELINYKKNILLKDNIKILKERTQYYYDEIKFYEKRLKDLKVFIRCLGREYDYTKKIGEKQSELNKIDFYDERLNYDDLELLNEKQNLLKTKIMDLIKYRDNAY